MVEVVRFKKEHLSELKEHVFGLSVKKNISSQQLENLENRNHSYTVIKEGRVLACAGITEFWPGRGEAWALLDKDIGPLLIDVSREVKKFLDEVPIKRIEAIVYTDFIEGIRWVKLLGFKLESPCMKAYGRNGKDCMLFSRVKE